MNSRLWRSAGLAGLLAVTSLAPAWAQEAGPGAGTSMSCRLFPLACPGPAPAAPPPLLGTPEEQAAATAPPAETPVRHKSRAHKRVAKHHAK